MSNDQHLVPIDSELRLDIKQQVLKKLEISESIGCTKQNLEDLFKAWCRNIPFDNFWKRMDLIGKSFSQLDQLDPNNFFELWLEHGVGGTCWVTTNAMFELLKDLGFNARVISCSMGDMGIPNHGSIIVTIDNEELIIDTSVLNEQPIELANIKKENEIHPIQVIHTDSKTTVLFEFVMSRKQMPWTLIDNDINLDTIKSLHETSINASLFNDCIYIRKNSENKTYSLIGNTFYIKSSDKIEAQTLDNNEIKKTLVDVFGFSKEITNHIAQTNLFELPKQSMLLELIK